MRQPGSPPGRAPCVPAAPWNRAPRGVTAVLVAICLVMLCAFLALALNVGHLFSVRGELQNAADAAALAGAQDLDGTLVPLESVVPLIGAKATGKEFAQRHATDTGTKVQVASVDVSTAIGDVEVGFWDRAKSTFKPAPSLDLPINEATASCRTLPCINAVRVQTYRDADHAGSVPIALGPILGKLTSNLTTEAIAVSGGPCGMKCIGLPIVLPDCGGVEKILKSPCVDGAYVGGEFTVMFKSANTDTGAWADLGAGANTINCLLEELSQSADTQACVSNSKCKLDENVGVLPDIEVINGQVNSACAWITTLYQRPDSKYVVPIVDAECPAPPVQEQWNQSWHIVTHVTIQITSAPNCAGSDKSFKIRILCDEVTEQASAGGCAAAGTWVRPGLVR